MTKKILTIAGSDITGGAGQAADLKVFSAHHCYGMSALSCIVTFSKAHQYMPEIYPVHASILKDQLDTITDLNYLDAIKTGMLPEEKQIHLVARWLKLQAENNVPIIIDPVMVCKNNGEENLEKLKESIIKELLPLATVTTPNLVEAEALADMKIQTKEDMAVAAEKIHELGPKYVVIKGGARLEGDVAVDLLFDGEEFHYFEREKITEGFNHGAGCSFAAAITSNLALEKNITDAVRDAKEFVYHAIDYGLELNSRSSAVFVNYK